MYYVIVIQVYIGHNVYCSLHWALGIGLILAHSLISQVFSLCGRVGNNWEGLGTLVT